MRTNVWYVYIVARTRHIRFIFHTRFYTRSNYNNNKPPRLVLRSHDRPVSTYPLWTSLVLWNWFNIFISLCKLTRRVALRCVLATSTSPHCVDFFSCDKKIFNSYFLLSIYIYICIYICIYIITQYNSLQCRVIFFKASRLIETYETLSRTMYGYVTR